MRLSGWMALAATAAIGAAQAQAQDGCDRCRGKQVVKEFRGGWGPHEGGFRGEPRDFMMYRRDMHPGRRVPGPEMERRFIYRMPERQRFYEDHREFRGYPPMRMERLPEHFEKGFERAPRPGERFHEERIEKRIERDGPPHYEKRIERAPEHFGHPAERVEKRIERAPERDVIKRAAPGEGGLEAALDKISRALDQLDKRLSNLEKRVGERGR